MAKDNKKTKRILNENWDAIVKQIEAGETKTNVAQLFGVSRQALSARLNKHSISTTTKPVPLKTLILDIETSPLSSYHWGLWQQNIGDPMRFDDDRSFMMSIAMKWLGSDEVFYFENRTEDDSEILKETFKFLDRADLVVAHNGKKFDLKKINAFALINNLKPPSPYRIIDTLVEAKKHFAFERNTLDYIARALGCSHKLKHEDFSGFELWKQCLAGNSKAWDEMRIYNEADVTVLEEVYLKMRPYIKSHPNVAVTANSTVPLCASCGSANLTQDGYSITNVSKFVKYVCNDCGSFSRERKSVLEPKIKEKLLTSVANG